MESTAFISEDGLYRYSLERRWEKHGALMTFIMLNPSTADASVDDPTIRRCMGFARRGSFGYSGIRVVNLFGLRSREPDDLRFALDPVGPLNQRTIRDALAASEIELGIVVVAWGAWNPGNQWVRRQVDLVKDLAADEDAVLWCLGRTKAGAPRHPLYLKADTKLERWP